MNVFAREIKAYRKSTLIWAVSLSALVILFLLMFPAFFNDVGVANKVISSLPVAIRNALDISLKNFFTIYGFFAYLMMFVGLAGAIQAMSLGVGMISKEESGKTADFLLSKPISRTKVFFSKLLAALFLILITNIVFSITAILIANMVTNETIDLKIFILISATLFLIQIFFVALGFFMSVILPKVKSIVSVSLPTVFTFFIIGMMGAILGNEEVRYICPFKFFDTAYIIDHGAYEMKFLVIETIFVIVAIAASYIIFVKKDIRAAS